MQFATTLESDSIDDEMGVNMITVGVGTDQHLTILKELRQPSRGEVCLRWVDLFSLWEALHQMIEPSAVILMVQQLGAEKIVVGTLRLTVDAADQVHITPTGFLILGGIAHYPGHAASALPFGAFHEIDDGYVFHLLRSSTSRSSSLIAASS